MYYLNISNSFNLLKYISLLNNFAIKFIPYVSEIHISTVTVKYFYLTITSFQLLIACMNKARGRMTLSVYKMHY